jgi:hypothetical protein
MDKRVTRVRVTQDVQEFVRDTMPLRSVQRPHAKSKHIVLAIVKPSVSLEL